MSIVSRETIKVAWSPHLSGLPEQLIAIQERSAKPLVVICRVAAIQGMLGHLLAHSSPHTLGQGVPVRLTTFDRWIEDMWIQYGDGRCLIDDATRRAHIGQIINTYKESLPPAIDSPEGRKMLAVVCQNYGTARKATGPLHRTVQLVQEIAERYTKDVRDGNYIDIGEAAVYLGRHLSQLPHDIVLYGFSDLTRPQQIIMDQVAHSNILHVLGVGEQGSLMHEHTMRMIEELGVHALGMKGSDEKGVACHEKENGALALLARQIYRKKERSISPDEDVLSFRVASGDIAQIVSIVSEIIRLQRVEGIRRIAVVLPTLKRYLPGLVRELERRNIAYQIDVEIPLSGTEFGTAFIALLRIASCYNDATTITTFTSSPYSGWTAEDSALFDWRMRNLQKLKVANGPEMIDQMIKLTQRGTGKSTRMLNLFRACMSGGSPQNWQDIIDDMLGYGVSDGFATSHQQVVTMAAYRSIGTVIEEIARSGNTRINAADLLEALSGCDVQINPVYGTRDVVFTTPQRADGLMYDAVILAGTDSKARAASTTLGGTDRMLNYLGMGQYVGKTEQSIERLLSGRNQYYEASLLRAPQKYLSIIYQRFDEEGQELQPSGFLEEILSHFQDKPERFEKTLERLIASSDEYIWDSPEVCATLYRTDVGTEIAQTVVSARRGAHLLPESDLEAPLSATKIERYAQCPYRWFIQFVVGGYELDRDTAHLDIGNDVHKILEITFKEWHSSRREPITEENVDELHALADSMMVILENEGLTVSPLDNPDNYLRVQQYVHTIIAGEPKIYRSLDEKMMPILFEIPITPEMNVRFADTRIRGIIDRVDASDEHYVVTDYKSLVNKSQDDMIHDRDLQAVIYLLALEQLAGRGEESSLATLEGKSPVAALYRSYKTGKKTHISDPSAVTMHSRNKTLHPEKHQPYLDRIAWAHELIEHAVHGIRAGDIALPVRDPKQEYTCTYCPRRRCPQRKEGTP